MPQRRCGRAGPAQPAHRADLRTGRAKDDHHLHREGEHLVECLERMFAAGRGAIGAVPLELKDGEAIPVREEAHADGVTFLDRTDGLRFHLLRVVVLFGALLRVVAEATVGGDANGKVEVVLVRTCGRMQRGRHRGEADEE
eukprot:scaffold57950_cov30-Tisochrysis_lutea.AAC.2